MLSLNVFKRIANPVCGLVLGQSSKIISPAPAKVTVDGIQTYALLLTQLGQYALCLVHRLSVKMSLAKFIVTELETGFSTRSELVGQGCFIGSA